MTGETPDLLNPIHTPPPESAGEYSLVDTGDIYILSLLDATFVD
jgi:hypothetical protein